MGVNVVGDLAELVPDRELVAQLEPPPEPTAQVLADQGVTALAGLLEEYSVLRRRTHGERLELQRLQELEREMRERPGKHLLRGLSERWAWAGKARAAARRTRERLGSRPL